jgi:hypothetical protein
MIYNAFDGKFLGFDAKIRGYKLTSNDSKQLNNRRAKEDWNPIYTINITPVEFKLDVSEDVPKAKLILGGELEPHSRRIIQQLFETKGVL